MSAYVVDRNHVAYLVDAAMFLSRGDLRWYWGHDEELDEYTESAKLGPGDYDEAERVGQMLWDECVKSVRHRYPADDHGQLPGTVGSDHVFNKRDCKVTRRIDPVQVLASCDCYAYQSCEHPAWKKSEAFAFIERLRSAAWHALPGYEEASWGAPAA